MRKDKQKAINLRKSGKSYKHISQLMNIPKSTLSDWLGKCQWSKTIQKRLAEEATIENAIRLKELNNIRGQQLIKIYEQARQEAIKEFESFKFHPLFITGIMLYWGEGDKNSPHLTRIGNVDTLLIKIFIKFLLEICGVSREKIRAHILIYPDLNADTCINFWMEHANLTRNNFTKCVTIQGRHKTRRLKHGVCYVNVSGSYLKTKMRIWLDLLPQALIVGKYYLRE